jgi:hypothetical protein
LAAASYGKPVGILWGSSTTSIMTAEMTVEIIHNVKRGGETDKLIKT